MSWTWHGIFEFLLYCVNRCLPRSSENSSKIITLFSFSWNTKKNGKIVKKYNRTILLLTAEKSVFLKPSKNVDIFVLFSGAKAITSLTVQKYARSLETLLILGLKTLL